AAPSIQKVINVLTPAHLPPGQQSMPRSFLTVPVYTNGLVFPLLCHPAYLLALLVAVSILATTVSLTHRSC
ncbi:MAG: hypothetical protein ACXVDA_23135, partial [Ktedonobacterales bacterium]